MATSSAPAPSPIFRLSGRHALVTGASSGIGKAVAQALCELGASVTVVARREAQLQKVAAELGCQYAVADLSRLDDIERLLSQVSKVDILVSNAGGPPAGRATELTEADWHAGYELTFMSTVRLCQGVIEPMRQQGWGRIVALTSQSVRRPMLNIPVSNAMRAAVTNYLRTLALELGPDGITCNTVAPGITATERLDKLYPTPEQKAQQLGKVPLGRFATPREVGAAAAFLCTQEAGFITGQELLVDGGAGN